MIKQKPCQGIAPERSGALEKPTKGWKEDLLLRLEAIKPKSLLAVGRGADRAFARYLERHPGCLVERVPVSAGKDPVQRLQALGRFDFGFLCGVLEYLDKEAAYGLIARVRDVHVPRFCVLVPEETSADDYRSRWSDADFLELGMTLVDRFSEEGQVQSLYGFDIASYKSTPDWLSPRDWAHPELWGKHRW